MSTGEFFGALVAVIVAGTGSTIALAVYLGGRIDRLSDHISQLHEDFVLHKADPEAHR